MTGEMYDELITSRIPGKPLNTVPWVLIFVKHYRSIEEANAKEQYDKLAQTFAGKVRFAWIDRDEEELLTSTFEAMYMPQTFLIKDGLAYWYRDYPKYDQLGAYITEGKYVNSTTQFP